MAILLEQTLAPYLGSLNHPTSRLAYLSRHGRFVASDSPDFDPKAGEHVYRFNALGYRGEDFNSGAPFKLFVFGCSYTFGSGLRYGQTWPYLLKQAMAPRLSLRRSQISLQNFSQLGASNSFIARTVVEQCERMQPDLAVIHFTHHQRTEYLGRDARWSNDTEHLGSWSRQEPAGSGEILPPGRRYLQQYTYRGSLLDTLKNMYLVQCALKRRGIPYVFIWETARQFFRSPISSTPALRDFALRIDKTRLCPVSILSRGIRVDAIKKGDAHPGPKSQVKLVGRLLDWMPIPPVKAAGPPVAQAANAPIVVGASTASRKVLVIGVRRCGCKGEIHDCACTESFCRVFKTRYRDAERCGATIHDPILTGTSNDALVRKLLAESRGYQPDIVLVAFADPGAAEHFVTRFLAKSRLVELGVTSPPSALTTNRRYARSQRWFGRYMNDELCWLNALKNMLLAQEHLGLAQTTFAIAPPPGFVFDGDGALAHPVLRSLAARLDRTCIAEEWTPQPRLPRLQADQALDVEPRWRRALASYLARLRARRPSKDDDPNIYPLW
ncbi:MAG TPA: hypothetical protein VJ890_15780 [Vineibacter sp.]|nr:hypothetical protein [Vineibacter sp.]